LLWLLNCPCFSCTLLTQEQHDVVGHVDEFNNNWIWHQWLLAKPGTYRVTVAQKGQTVQPVKIAVWTYFPVALRLWHPRNLRGSTLVEALWDAGKGRHATPKVQAARRKPLRLKSGGRNSGAREREA